MDKLRMNKGISIWELDTTNEDKQHVTIITEDNGNRATVIGKNGMLLEEPVSMGYMDLEDMTCNDINNGELQYSSTYGGPDGSVVECAGRLMTYMSREQLCALEWSYGEEYSKYIDNIDWNKYITTEEE